MSGKPIEETCRALYLPVYLKIQNKKIFTQQSKDIIHSESIAKKWVSVRGAEPYFICIKIYKVKEKDFSDTK